MLRNHENLQCTLLHNILIAHIFQSKSYSHNRGCEVPCKRVETYIRYPTRRKHKEADAGIQGSLSGEFLLYGPYSSVVYMNQLMNQFYTLQIRKKDKIMLLRHISKEICNQKMIDNAAGICLLQFCLRNTVIVIAENFDLLNDKTCHWI